MGLSRDTHIVLAGISSFNDPAAVHRLLGDSLAALHQHAWIHSPIHEWLRGRQTRFGDRLGLTVICLTLQMLVSFLIQRSSGFRAITVGTLISSEWPG